MSYANNNIKNILFLGDITGRLGRQVCRDFILFLKNNRNKSVCELLEEISKDNNTIKLNTNIDIIPDIDFIIANGENASGGFGLTQKNYSDLISFGINAITSGNHIWDKKDIFSYINEADKLIRPINYPDTLPGMGYRIFDVANFKLAIISLLGRTFMPLINSPFEVLPDIINKIKEITPNIFIDIHAEATAEKICMGHWLSNLDTSCIVGTHTHVQTSDERIINGKSAYITDVGFCGAYDSVIGMSYETSLQKLSLGLNLKHEVIKSGVGEANAIIVSIDMSSGVATSISRINYYKNYNL